MNNIRLFNWVFNTNANTFKYCNYHHDARAMLCDQKEGRVAQSSYGRWDDMEMKME
jgi:hypothetical protein